MRIPLRIERALENEICQSVKLDRTLLVYTRNGKLESWDLGIKTWLRNDKNQAFFFSVVM